MINRVEKFKQIIVQYDHQVMLQTQEETEMIEQLVTENNNLKYLLLIHDELADGQKVQRVIEQKMKEVEEQMRQENERKITKLNNPRDIKIRVKKFNDEVTGE